MQIKLNPDAWTSFSIEDYCYLCTHKDKGPDWNIMETLVKGGSPDYYHSSVIIEGGYLNKTSDGKYLVTSNLVDTIKVFIVINL